MNKLYAAVAIAIVLAGATYGLVQYGRALERADHNEKVAALQDQLAKKSQKLMEFESQAADDTRKIINSEKERINAIQTSSKFSAKIRQLERALKKAASEADSKRADKDIDDINYRVIVTDDTYRVWEEGRNCVGLPESDRASVLQKRLPEVTGDDINRLVTYAQAEYCGCGLKYNELWRTYQRTVDECNKKGPE